MCPTPPRPRLLEHILAVVAGFLVVRVRFAAVVEVGPDGVPGARGRGFGKMSPIVFISRCIDHRRQPLHDLARIKRVAGRLKVRPAIFRLGGIIRAAHEQD